MLLITILFVQKPGVAVVLFNSNYLHHTLAWKLVIKFQQKDTSKLYLNGVELICFTLSFIGLRWLPVESVFGVCN